MGGRWCGDCGDGGAPGPGSCLIRLVLVVLLVGYGENIRALDVPGGMMGSTVDDAASMRKSFSSNHCKVRAITNRLCGSATIYLCVL